MKLLLSILLLSITTVYFSQSPTMKWHDGDMISLVEKARKEKKVGFLYIYENTDACKKFYKQTFIYSKGGGFSASDDVVKLHNKYYISGRYTVDEISILKKDIELPAFIWLNTEGEVSETRVGADALIKYSSEKWVKAQKSDVLNFGDNLRKLGCEDLLCQYNELHRVFKNTPDHLREDDFYELIENFAGGIDSEEIQWLINHPDFEEQNLEDKVYILYEALTFSYVKETGDETLGENFKSYATDKLLKPLKKYAAPLKRYLIEEEEGDGF